MHKIYSVLFAGLLLFPLSLAAPAFEIAGTKQAVKTELMLLAIDDSLVPLKRNLCFYLSKPQVRPEPVLTPDRSKPDSPDFMAAHFYGAVLHDNGKFRMWYYAVHPKESLKDLVEGPICYAESTDGITWQKPDLGQVNFKGSLKNNIIALVDGRIEGVAVIKDADDPDPNRRYKMAFNPSDSKYSWTLRCATSPDGIRWKLGREQPIQSFLEFASFYKFNGSYFINAQTFGRGEASRPQGRQAYAWASPDFDHWIQEPAVSFTLPEPVNGSGYGGRYDQLHLGVGGASFGNVVIGLYGRWHERGWGESGTSCDLGLVISNDGLFFREPVKDHTLISAAESPVTPVKGKNYPTILIQSNGILNVGNETRIYHGRWRNVEYPSENALDYWAEVALATIPRDRWGAIGLYSDAQDGSAWTAPIKIGKSWKMFLNGTGLDGIRVEAGTDNFDAVTELSGANAGATMINEGLDTEVLWKGKPGALIGKTVRFRLHFLKKGQTDPRLYAVYLRSE